MAIRLGMKHLRYGTNLEKVPHHHLTGSVNCQDSPSIIQCNMLDKTMLPFDGMVRHCPEWYDKPRFALHQGFRSLANTSGRVKCRGLGFFVSVKWEGCSIR